MHAVLVLVLAHALIYCLGENRIFRVFISLIIASLLGFHTSFLSRLFANGIVLVHALVAKSTRYGLDGLGIESLWEERFSAPVQTVPGVPPGPGTMGTGTFTGCKATGAWR